MTIQIALDNLSNDIIKLEGGGIARVTDGRYTIQLVKNKLLTILGEWKLDQRKGWLNFDDFTRNPDLFDIEMRARDIILSCEGVQKIDSITLDLSDRVLTISFEATTVYGVIETTIPWGI